MHTPIEQLVAFCEAPKSRLPEASASELARQLFDLMFHGKEVLGERVPEAELPTPPWLAPVVAEHGVDATEVAAAYLLHRLRLEAGLEGPMPDSRLGPLKPSLQAAVEALLSCEDGPGALFLRTEHGLALSPSLGRDERREAMETACAWRPRVVR